MRGACQEVSYIHLAKRAAITYLSRDLDRDLAKRSLITCPGGLAKRSLITCRGGLVKRSLITCRGGLVKRSPITCRGGLAKRPLKEILYTDVIKRSCKETCIEILYRDLANRPLFEILCTDLVRRAEILFGNRA